MQDRERGRYQYPLENKARRLGTEVDPSDQAAKSLHTSKSDHSSR